MNILELVFFALSAFMAVAGGIATVASKNPIRGAMGLLGTIVGVAGLYLMLSAEFLAAIQILVYAGAVVILFVFVIMLLGPSAMGGQDAKGAGARYLAAGVLLLSSVLGVLAIATTTHGFTTFATVAKDFGHIEPLGKELFTRGLVPFELSSALLLVSVVGAVAVARGKQSDPTTMTASEAKGVNLAGAQPQHARADKPNKATDKTKEAA